MEKCPPSITLRRCQVFVFLVVIGACCHSSHAQQLPLKAYTTADGLAQNQINRIVRDSRGYLWFCTAEGLSRFDGYSFTNYTTDHGLPNRSIRNLLETRSGVYWLATGNGLCRFNPQSKDQMFVTYLPRENQWAKRIWSVYQDRAGTVWIGTEDGLYKMGEADGQIEFQFIEMGMPSHALVESILEDRSGVLWVGVRDSGLYRRAPDGSVLHITTRHGLPGDRVTAMLEDRQGRLWIGMTSGLCLLLSQPGSIRPLFSRPYARKDFGLLSDWVSDLFQSGDGRIWVAVSGGLSEVIPAAKSEEPLFRSHVRGCRSPLGADAGRPGQCLC